MFVRDAGYKKNIEHTKVVLFFLDKLRSQIAINVYFLRDALSTRPKEARPI